jgi:hypothetical protein
LLCFALLCFALVCTAGATTVTDLHQSPPKLP